MIERVYVEHWVRRFVVRYVYGAFSRDTTGRVGLIATLSGTVSLLLLIQTGISKLDPAFGLIG